MNINNINTNGLQNVQSMAAFRWDGVQPHLSSTQIRDLFESIPTLQTVYEGTSDPIQRHVALSTPTVSPPTPSISPSQVLPPESVASTSSSTSTEVVACEPLPLPSPPSSFSSSSSTSITEATTQPVETLVPSLSRLMEVAGMAARAVHSYGDFMCFRLEVDTLLRTALRPPFFAMDGHPLMTVCGCQDCRRSGTQHVESPFGNTDRADFMIALLQKIVRLFPDRESPIRIASLSSGGCFSELMLAGALRQLGYRNIDWTLVDGYFGSVGGGATAQEFERLMRSVSPGSPVRMEARDPSEFVRLEEETGRYNIVFMMHNDGSNAADAVTGMPALAGGEYVTAILSSHFNSDTQSRYRITNSAIPAPTPLVLHTEEARQQLMTHYERFQSSILTTLAEHDPVNPSTSMIRLTSPAFRSFARGIAPFFEYDGNLPTCVLGIPQIFRPADVGPIFRLGPRQSWTQEPEPVASIATWKLCEIVNNIRTNKRDTETPLVLHATRSQGYLNELFLHVLLGGLGYMTIQWVLEPASTPEEIEAQRVFQAILSEQERHSPERQARVCVIASPENLARAELEVDTVQFEVTRR